MSEKRILPEEIREIIRKISADNAYGPESEGGIYGLEEVERALSGDGKIDSSLFGQHFPRISQDLKTKIAINFLYEIAQENLLDVLSFERPRFKKSPDGSLEAISTREHLRNLVSLFELIANQ